MHRAGELLLRLTGSAVRSVAQGGLELGRAAGEGCHVESRPGSSLEHPVPKGLVLEEVERQFALELFDDPTELLAGAAEQLGEATLQLLLCGSHERAEPSER